MNIQIAPSILAADFSRLQEEIDSVQAYVDMFHIDVMDGHFVPNITLGAPVLACLKSNVPFECHLMIENPERYLEDFVKAGAKSITVHLEATQHLHRLIQQIKSLGVRAAVALNPATPVQLLHDILPDLDMVLIMSVNPGFGGQKFIDQAIEKIRELRKMAPNIDIQVDGGIQEETARLCKQAGANILVAGTSIFKAKDRKVAIESLRNA